MEKKGSNTRCRTDSGMPMPLSATATLTLCPGSWPVVIASVPPSGIASSAFRTRLVISSVSAAGRPLIRSTVPSSSRRSSGRLSWAIFSSQRGRVIATASCTIWLTSTDTNCSSGRSRANCWMRRTVSAPSTAADSTTRSERSRNAGSCGFCFMSCA
ncbi:MAG: hypothetical protein A3D33_06170 [Candidatus Rokubacteria bacterium RIFCSPHIGHO2_02_FULL_73_26]|nr:MAG: hypothetical protein A3D33_06170 [Candidatus Rokubacteria bacterium RIFCSPHIGHO2_02_FULL_73_26]